MLARAGVAVPPTARCVSREHPASRDASTIEAIRPAHDLATRCGYPLVVKPNRLSHGRGVRAVQDAEGLARAIEGAWELDPIAIVQEAIEGRDFRLDFLDGQFLVGYERRALRVIGDGARSLRALLAEVDPRCATDERLAALRRDTRFERALRRRGWSLDTIPEAHAELSFDGPIQNLNGASAPVLIPTVDESLRTWCVRVGGALGLRHFGIDLKARSLDADPVDAVVIEVNASPLVSQIYALGHVEAALEATMAVLEAARR